MHVAADLSNRGSRSAWSRRPGELDVPREQRRLRGAARLPHVTDEQWEAVWQLNVMSYVRAIRAAVPGMKSAAAA